MTEPRRELSGALVLCGYSFRCTRMPARLTTLFAKILIAAATMASSWAGSQTVGVGGHSIAISGGLPRFGSISSMRGRVLPLMVPLASAYGMIGTRCLLGHRGPGLRLHRLPGPLMCMGPARSESESHADRHVAEKRSAPDLCFS